MFLCPITTNPGTRGALHLWTSLQLSTEIVFLYDTIGYFVRRSLRFIHYHTSGFQMDVQYITDYALYVQVILVLAINFVLLTMMYKYIRGVRMYSTKNICCAYPKANEMIFVVCLFVLPLIVPIIEIVMQQNPRP